MPPQTTKLRVVSTYYHSFHSFVYVALVLTDLVIAADALIKRDVFRKYTPYTYPQVLKY